MTDNYDAVLQKLKAALDKDDAPDTFDKEERDTLRRMIKAFETLQSWGKLGRLALWILMSLAGAFIAWEKITERFQ